MAKNNIDDWQEVPIDDWQEVSLQDSFVDDSPSQLEAGLRGAAQGATFDFADEIEGAARAAVQTITGPEKLQDLLDTYYKQRDIAREKFKQSEEEYPKTYLAGEVGGGFASSLGTGGAGALKALSSIGKIGVKEGLGKAVLKGAASAGAQGALYGAGTAEELGDVPSAARDSAIISAGIGGSVPIFTTVAKPLISNVGKGIKYGAKELAKKSAGLSDEVMDFATSNAPLVREATGDLSKYAEKLAEEGSTILNQANKYAESGVKVLSKNKDININPLIKNISKIPTNTLDDTDVSKIKRTIDTLKEKSGIDNLISEKELKSTLSDLYDIAYSSSSQSGKKNLKKVANIISEELKTRNPAYKEFMKESSRRFGFVKELQDMYGLDQGLKEFTSEELAEFGPRLMQQLQFPKRKLDTAINSLKNLLKTGKLSDERFLQGAAEAGFIEPNMIDKIKAEDVIRIMKDYKPSESMSFLSRLLGGSLGVGYFSPEAGIAGFLGGLAAKPVSQKLIKESDKISKIVEPLGKITSKATDIGTTLASQSAIRKSAEDISDTQQKTREVISYKPEQVQGLLNKATSSEQYKTYAGPLQRAVESDDEQRERIMFGLMQQPAFRKMLSEIE